MNRALERDGTRAKRPSGKEIPGYAGRFLAGGAGGRGEVLAGGGGVAGCSRGDGRDRVLTGPAG